MADAIVNQAGGCNCGAVRYAILSEPLFTHICHCTECQRESRGAFNMTLLVLSDSFKITASTPSIGTGSRKSGNEYEVYSCSECRCTLAGHGLPPGEVTVVRPGTLDDTSWICPQAHIWTREKQNWISIPNDIPSFEEGYDAMLLWPKESLDRLGNG